VDWISDQFDRRPDGLLRTPVIFLAAVATFVVWTLVLAAVLIGRDPGAGWLNARADLASMATSTATATPRGGAATTAAPPAEGAGVAYATVTALPTIPPQLTQPPGSGATSTTSAAPNSSPVPAATATTAVPATPVPPATATPAGALLDRLPTLAGLPDGFVVVDEGPFTADELAALHPDPELARRRLEAWGFRQAYRRQFELPDPPAEVAATRTTIVVAVVVELGSSEQALEAIQNTRDDVMARPEAQVREVEIVPLGDRSLAGHGTLDVGGQTFQAAYVWVQQGSVAYTLAGLSPGIDPLADLLAIATALFSR
jgi:hypothetical protein